MPCTLWKYWRLVMILVMLVVCAAASAQTAPGATPQGSARFLVYFDEFSAFLSDEAKTIIADAAKRARESGARRIVVQARASATGTAETNKYLAQTRSSIVTDQLEADGIAARSSGRSRSDRQAPTTRRSRNVGSTSSLNPEASDP